MDGRPDDLLEEPLLLNGVFIRRWADFARLARPHGAWDGVIPGGAPEGSAPGRKGDVPAPRTPGASDRVASSVAG